MKLSLMTLLILPLICATGTLADNLALLNPEAQTLIDSCQHAYARDDFDGAVDFAKDAIELEPQSSVCQFWLGIAYSEKTESGFFVSKLLNARKCKKAFERAVEFDSSSLDAREGLIEYHVRAPGVAGGSAETAWEQVDFIMRHDSVRGYLAAAYIHERKEEDTASAERAFVDAVEVDSTNITAQLRLAGFYARHGAFNKAESVLVVAVATGDRESLMNLGWFYINQSRSADAVAAINELLVKDPMDTEALLHSTVAQAYAAQPTADTLDALFRKAAEGCAEVLLFSALRDLATSPSPTQGVEDLEEYLESDPCYVYRPCWSYPHLKSGLHSYRPGRAYAHYLLSQAYKRLPRKSRDATKELERALELDPTFWPASQELNRDN